MTKNRKMPIISLGIVSFVILVLLDQITKKLAVLKLKDQEPFILIKNVFQLYYLENRGAAFGILQGKRTIFIILTVIVLVFMAYCYIKLPYAAKFLKLRIVIVLIASGAVGNCIDRSLHGYVVDFFYFNLINFPIFNVADIYVTCSAVLLVILILFVYKEQDITDLMKSLRFSQKHEK